jgi:hypothetical protein
MVLRDIRRLARVMVLSAVGLAVSFPALAASVSDFAVRVSGTVQTSPTGIVLSWPLDPTTTGYILYRKLRDDTSWPSSGTTLPANSTGYTDTSVVVGGAYEYRIEKNGPDYYGYGYIYAGIEVPLVANRGKVILLVDSSLASSLVTELARLRQDLVGDGWTVIRHDVPRMTVDPANASSSAWSARSNELANVKGLIKTDYNADPGNVKAVLLFGHVAVPYSGDIYPDGHTTHRGAWPADVFYGDMNGVWGDSSVTSTGGNARNRNVPGDGKFDPTWIPSDVELEVGRVDFANMPAFSQGETELLRGYLNKDHNFRHVLYTVERRGLIDDHLGLTTSEPIAANGWRNFAPFFGAASTFTGEWLTTLASIQVAEVLRPPPTLSPVTRGLCSRCFLGAGLAIGIPQTISFGRIWERLLTR